MMIHLGNLQDILVPPVEGVAGGGTAYGWDDGGLRNLSPLKGSIDPSEVQPKKVEQLLPMADIVTPNLKEASALLGSPKLETVGDMHAAAKALHDMGPRGGVCDEPKRPLI
ncbi:hypothetical protein G4B88_014720 [Cannabis sativa]|uniref:Pyridoxamine kinase/Phosphomethylpyrimidine kinase domain-containing protein n=1 Tax=Cannabis sativa TaxID=3483 RepID=A0A7J6I9J9_CANSA|nr:hypothetical protein G4B88_014720 [Cannabis sativa]